MSIICTLIARQDTPHSNDLESGKNFHILVEVSNGFTGNFPQVTREFVLKCLPKEDRAIYNYRNKYLFHILKQDTFVYICLTEEAYPKRRAQTYLSEIKSLFFEKISQKERDTAISFSLKNNFAGAVQEKMDYFNRNIIDPKLSKIRQDANDVMNIMEQNLESLMERGDMIEMLVKKVHELRLETTTLKERSERLKEKSQMECVKKGAVVAVGATILCFFLFL